MDSRTALTLSIGVLGGLAVALNAEVITVPIWVVFLAWASFSSSAAGSRLGSIGDRRLAGSRHRRHGWRRIGRTTAGLVDGSAHDGLHHQRRFATPTQCGDHPGCRPSGTRQEAG